MARKRVLEIDQPLRPRRLAGFKQHDVLRMIIAQYGHTGLLPFDQRAERGFPGRSIAFAIHFQPHSRAIPFDQQQRLAQIDRHVVGCEGPRRQTMQPHQRVDRLCIDCALVIRMLVDPLAHAMVAEIFGQHPSLGRVLGDDRGGAHAVCIEPASDVQERRGVFMRRRCMHQHCALGIFPEPEIAAKTGIARERRDFRAFPLGIAQELVNLVERRIAHGQRLCQDVPGVTTASRPSPTFSNAIARQPGSCANPPA